MGELLVTQAQDVEGVLDGAPPEKPVVWKKSEVKELVVNSGVSYDGKVEIRGTRCCSLLYFDGTTLEQSSRS